MPDPLDSRQAPQLLTLLAATLLSACGEDTALDLDLFADPKYNSEASVLASLAQIRLVVDSPVGLYPGTTSLQGDGYVIKDLDSDGAAELEAEVDVAGLDSLPLIRIERGGLPDVPLEIQLDGFSKGDVLVAAGGVEGKRFTEGIVDEEPVPLNLKAEFRPPTVDKDKGVFPPSGSKDLLPAGLSSVLVIFSKAMNPDLLKVQGDNPAFEVVNVGTGVRVPAKSINVQPLYPNGPSQAGYLFDGHLELGATYEVIVWPKARDISGRPLDTVPLQEGNQEFRSRFSTALVEVAAPACHPDCQGTWCANGGTVCPEGLTCDEATGFCGLVGCGYKGCPEGKVCDPSLSACVDDCRIHGTYGGCPGDRPRCLSSGLCSA